MTLQLTRSQAWDEFPDSEINERLIRSKDARVNERVFVRTYTRKKA